MDPAYKRKGTLKRSIYGKFAATPSINGKNWMSTFNPFPLTNRSVGKMIEIQVSAFQTLEAVNNSVKFAKFYKNQFNKNKSFLFLLDLRALNAYRHWRMLLFIEELRLY